MDQGNGRHQDQKSSLYGRALVVIAAEHYATRLVVPPSRRMPPTHWGSRKDHAAKALKRLAGPHIPASVKRLEQAIQRAHDTYNQAQQDQRAKPQMPAHDPDAATAAEAAPSEDTTGETATADADPDVDQPDRAAAADA